ncbi:MAG: lipid-A-disaccharide synthase [Gammaproteobacteria bacterium]|nr:lipid-A-disaccharide synthase [Gammaproteobacteria bacterium]MCW8973150.1 lipid-A-disaccharide synthase [Gammaproteobacteria bacterium]MCW8991898.1 lipid-A-disaccharide synthase [Gammaproteobacteria bacterium]
MNNASNQVLIVAGEASGDHHAARLVEELHKCAPDVHFAGIGGERMRRAGVEILVDSADMAVVGLVEVLANYRFLKGVLDRMRGELRERRPDMLILVDYPDFNLRLAATAKELGIKVLYYISPQIWAWRQKRVYKIKKLVDMMAVVFPFEVPFYEQAGVPVRFVGHPLVDEVKSELDREQAFEAFGLDPQRPVLGLFPGSRRSEIKRLLPTVLKSAALVKERMPEIQFLLPRASTLSDEFLAPYLAESDLEITVVPGRSYDVMRACDAIISASGTATLEIALMQVPLVVLYKIAPLSYRIISRLLKVEHIALCNIVAGERVAPELIQHDATPQKISREALSLLGDQQRAAAMRKRLGKIRGKLGGSGGSANIAELALELLND